MMNRLVDLLTSPAALVVAKSCVVLLVATCAAVLMRRRTAAERHLVWTAAIVVTLLLPVFAGVLPALRVPVRMSVPVQVAEQPAPGAGNASVVIVSDADARTGASQPSAVRQRPTLRSALLMVWLGGAVGVLGWIVIGRVALERLLRRSRRLEDEAWASVLKDARWLLDVRRTVRLHVSDGAAMPMTWGIVRPVVLLPAEAERWDEDRRRVVLLHELSHVLRYDCLTQLAAYLACALHWFNPLVWHAAQRMRVERERACDALVLSAGTSGADYAAHLLALAQGFRGRLRAPLLALQMARPSQLEGRLLLVLKGASHTRSLSRRAAAVIAALALLVALPVAAVRPVQAGVATSDARLIGGDPEIAVPLQDSLIERTLTVGSGRRLLLDLRTGGTVDVRGWDDNRVHVAVQLAGPDRRASAVEIDSSPDGADVVLWQTGAARTHSTAHRVTVHVPRRFDVEIRSAGGAVALHDVSGTFRGHTGGGDIRLDSLTGRVELMTGGGAIQVTSSRLDGRVTTASGDITLREVRGGIAASSGNGRVIIDRERGSGARPGSEATPAQASGDHISISTDGDSIARIVPRLPVSSAAHAITTRDRRAAILLRDSTIVLQYTDAGLEQLGRNTDELNEENFVEALIAGMLRGGLRMILDRGIEYSLRDLREARYSDGRLVFESVRGDDVFAEMNLNGGPLMAQFEPREARAFAQRVNAARARLRR